MPTLFDKIRTAAFGGLKTSREQQTLDKVTGGKPLPAEYIPAVDLGNYIDPDTSLGDPDKTGIFGTLTTTIVDKLFGNPSTGAKLKPRYLFGNTSAAVSEGRVSGVRVVSGGSYSPNGATLQIVCDGVPPTLEMVLDGTNTSIVRVDVVNPGSGNTFCTVTAVDNIGPFTPAVLQATVAIDAISSNMIYPELGGIFSKLAPDGSYIGGEFYTKEEADTKIETNPIRADMVSGPSGGSAFILSNANQDYEVMKIGPIAFDRNKNVAFDIQARIRVNNQTGSNREVTLQVYLAEAADMSNRIDINKSIKVCPSGGITDIEHRWVDRVNRSTGSFVFGTAFYIQIVSRSTAGGAEIFRGGFDSYISYIAYPGVTQSQIW